MIARRLTAGWLVGAEELEKIADLHSLLRGVAHVHVRVDSVLISSSFARSLDVSGFGEVGEDPLGRALGDPDLRGDISHPDVRGGGDAEEHLSVVGEESPGVTFGFT